MENNQNKESEHDYQLYQQLTSVNANLLYIQEQNEKMLKHLKEIQFNTSFIAIVIFLFILIRVALVVISARAGYSFINSFN